MDNKSNVKVHYQLRGIYLIKLAMYENNFGVWKRGRSQGRNWTIIDYLAKRYGIDESLKDAIIKGYVSLPEHFTPKDIKHIEWLTQTKVKSDTTYELFKGVKVCVEDGVRYCLFYDYIETRKKQGKKWSEKSFCNWCDDNGIEAV